MLVQRHICQKWGACLMSVVSQSSVHEMLDCNITYQSHTRQFQEHASMNMMTEVAAEGPKGQQGKHAVEH